MFVSIRQVREAAQGDTDAIQGLVERINEAIIAARKKGAEQFEYTVELTHEQVAETLPWLKGVAFERLRALYTPAGWQLEKYQDLLSGDQRDAPYVEMGRSFIFHFRIMGGLQCI
jgi:hypothetical protein